MNLILWYLSLFPLQYREVTMTAAIHVPVMNGYAHTKTDFSSSLRKLRPLLMTAAFLD